jgi:CRP-like cAMP-binding protein
MAVNFGPAATSHDTLDEASLAGTTVANSGQLDALVTLERIGMRRSMTRDAEIYAEGDAPDYWYKVVAGTVRLSKLLADGRRHVAEFCFPGDYFGLDITAERVFSAEAVGDVVLTRYSRKATDRLINEIPEFARHLCDMAMRELAQAQMHMLLLGRMTAPERVASFVLEMSRRADSKKAIEVPMSRTDIADYLGLTIETVCRILSSFKREGTIAIPNPHRIELRDLNALETVGDS